MCAGGGIGIRGSLRGCWEFSRAGSNPVPRTINLGKFMSRPKANSNFFKTWSSNMAYILGLIATDGCLVEHENGYNGLNITNKNKDILKNILTIINSEHKISIKSRSRLSNLRYFQIQIRDKTIYADLLRLGLTPRKSKTLRMPKNIPPEFFGDFIRGCLDGDGSVIVWQDPRWKHAWQMRTVFYSGSLAFLRDIQKCLCGETSLTKGSIQYAARAYVLRYSIADSVKLYTFIYQKCNCNSLFFERKRNKFEFFKQVRPDCFKKVMPACK